MTNFTIQVFLKIASQYLTYLQQIQEELESGQYRMKYIVTIADEASEETSENTSEEELQEVENGYVYVTYTRYIAVEDTVTEETTEQPKQ